MILEICVDDTKGLGRAIAGGAGRIELCSALDTGGLTVSPGFMRHAASAPIPVIALIRPRSGNFTYDEAELSIIAADITAAADAGLAGVAIGACEADGRLDVTALAALINHARGAFAPRAPSLTLHRASDLAPEPHALVNAATSLGFARILSSGGAVRAIDGLPRLAAMVGAAGRRIDIMAGSGVTASNAARIVNETGVTAIHASARTPARGSALADALGFFPASGETNEARVTDLVRALRALSEKVPKNDIKDTSCGQI